MQGCALECVLVGTGKRTLNSFVIAGLGASRSAATDRGEQPTDRLGSAFVTTARRIGAVDARAKPGHDDLL